MWPKVCKCMLKRLYLMTSIIFWSAAIVGDIAPSDNITKEVKNQLETEAMHKIRDMLGHDTAAGKLYKGAKLHLCHITCPLASGSIGSTSTLGAQCPALRAQAGHCPFEKPAPHMKGISGCEGSLVPQHVPCQAAPDQYLCFLIMHCKVLSTQGKR